MGNTKSRHNPGGGTAALSGPGQKSRSRHSRFHSGSSIGFVKSSKRHQQQEQTLPNDSGHYSIHEFMSPSSPLDRPETPTSGDRLGAAGAQAPFAWNHPNLSSPGRLDQQQHHQRQTSTSESSPHFQYRQAKVQQGTGPVGRMSGQGLRTTSRTMFLEDDSAGYVHGYNHNNSSNNNNNNSSSSNNNRIPILAQQHQRQTSYPSQGVDNGNTRPSSLTPGQSNGRISALHHASHTQQQQPSMHRTSVQPLSVPFAEEEQLHSSGFITQGHLNGVSAGPVAGMVSSMAAVNLGGNEGRMTPNGSSTAARVQRQPPHQDYYPSQSAPVSVYQQQQPLPNPITRSDPFKSSNGHQNYHNESNPVYQQDEVQYQQQQQQQPYTAKQPRLTTTYPSERERPVAGKSSNNILAGAGPLIEGSSPSSQRPPTADQVFARLARQFPTNPRETEKRERIYKWLDKIAEELTFNPDPEMPGWIIPVYPDEADHPETPFYLDRITYELDLMAPVGKPFRKAIDINCSSGAWALDMAMKFPRTVVYALDPLLDTMHLPLRLPENCKFRMRDVRDQEGEFDLVHQRLGAFRTPIQEWTPHFAELRRLTKPGGWIQLAESNGMLVRAGVEALKVNRWVERAALSTGLNPMQMVEALMPTLLGAGLINVECYDYGIPVGDWAGARGQFAMRSYLEMVESLKEEIVEMNRLEEGIFEETIELMKMECLTEKAELVMKVIYAQKPPITDDLWRR
ncbi:hypothetical protein BGX28_000317 [Mortierella sp. GBA30]|nr:hypothetical protein BGX28_000317 [Mortierella sp. GBA30]